MKVMKGRLNTTIYTVVVVKLIALFAVLVLAYEAGAKSNRLAGCRSWTR